MDYRVAESPDKRVEFGKLRLGQRFYRGSVAHLKQSDVYNPKKPNAIEEVSGKAVYFAARTDVTVLPADDKVIDAT